eukprot:ANDGO_07572.mRNA.1 Clusterin-associated protein 1 homolog
MSYRELRNFTESLRTLGYPRPVSLEQLRVPNFVLMADMLSWLSRRYDPAIDVPFDVSSDAGSEAARVAFVKNICSLLLSKARIKMNLKKLYCSDGHAVQELLKLTTILTASAAQSSVGGHDDEKEFASGLNEEDVFSPIPAAKVTELRSINSALTGQGATLYGLLAQEPELRSVRNRVLAKPLDLEDVQHTIQSRIQKAKATVSALQKEFATYSSDAENLQMKIEKKKSELERTEKRLKSLETVRPAFMDEFERLERELADLFVVYTAKQRNLAWLQSCVDTSKKRVAEKQGAADAQWSALREKMKSEENAILRGENVSAELGMVKVSGSLDADDDEDSDDESDDDDDLGDGVAGLNSGARFMGGGGDNDESSDISDLDDDGDLMDGDDDDDDDGDDDDDAVLNDGDDDGIEEDDGDGSSDMDASGDDF